MPGWPRNILSLTWNDNITKKYWHSHLHYVWMYVIPAPSIPPIWSSSLDTCWWQSLYEMYFFPQRDVGIISSFSYPGSVLIFQTNSKGLSSLTALDKRLFLEYVFFKAFALRFWLELLWSHILQVSICMKGVNLGFHISLVEIHTDCIIKTKVCSYHKCII